MEQVKSISMTNYQRLKGTVKVPLDRITLLCGPNSAGKSAIIDACKEMRGHVSELLDGSEDWWLKSCNFNSLSFDYLFGEVMEGRFPLPPFHYDSRARAWFETFDPTLIYVKELIGSMITLEFGSYGFSFYSDNKLLFRSMIALRCCDDEDTTFGYLAGDHFVDLRQKNFRQVDISEENEIRATSTNDDDYGLFIQSGEHPAMRHFNKVENGETSQLSFMEGCVFGPYECGSHSLLGYLKQGSSDVVENIRGLNIPTQGQLDLSSLVIGLLTVAHEAVWPITVSDSRNILDSNWTSLGELNWGDNTELGKIAARNGLHRGDDEEDSTLFSRINETVSSYFQSLEDFKFLLEATTSDQTTLAGACVNEIEDLLWYDRPPRMFRFFVAERNAKGSLTQRRLEEVGSGLSYCLPTLIATHLNCPCLIQQPELHLHPKAQCELGDVFIVALNSGTPSVIETHSEHLILRLLRRIRESTDSDTMPGDLKIDCDSVRILYFEADALGTKVHTIRIDEEGEFLDLWPKGFFSEREQELFPSGLLT